MKLIDSRKAKVVPVLLALEYGKPEKNGITRDRTWLKPLPEIKYDVAKAVWNEADNIDIIAKTEADAKMRAAWETFKNDFIKIEKTSFTRKIDAIINGEIVSKDQYVALSGFEIEKVLLPMWVHENLMKVKYQDYLKDKYAFAFELSWYEAVVMCNLLSVMHGFTPCYAKDGSFDTATWGKIPKVQDDTWNNITCDFSADGYRLPTLAELTYVKENVQSLGITDFENIEISGYGNGSHWCWDWYEKTDSEDAAVDPVGPETGTRRCRGIHYSSDPSSESGGSIVRLVRTISSERISEEEKQEIILQAKIRKAEAEAAAAKAKAEAEAKAKAERLAAQKQKTLDYADDLVAYKKTMLAKTVVPQEVFEFIMGYNPSERHGERYAVTNVNFYEIMVFCNKLSEIAGLTPVYSIKGSTDTNSWGEIPTSINADWDKYKADKKSDGFKLSELAVRSCSLYIDEVDNTEIVNDIGIRRSPTKQQEAIMKKTISFITSQNIPEKIGNEKKSEKYSFRIMRNK